VSQWLWRWVGMMGGLAIGTWASGRPFDGEAAYWISVTLLMCWLVPVSKGR
jgi:hypothetical protein